MHDGFSERYEVFFYFNAAAFAASLVLIILLLSKIVTNQRMWLHSMQLTMILDLFSLLGAYAAGSCRALKSSIYILVLVFPAIIYVGIHTLVSTRLIPRELKQNLQAMIKRVLKQQQGSIPLEKDVEKACKFILTLVTFAATITYQAGLNPPGGFWVENGHGSNKVHLAFPPYKHQPGTSVLRSNYLGRYYIFIISNSTSFVASLVIIILLLSPKLSVHGIRTTAVIVCVVVDLSCLIVAYAAGCCREVATSFYVVFIIVIVWISFSILAGFFVSRPVANWLQKVKTSSLCCVEKLDRVLSLRFSRHRPSKAEQENSYASNHHTSVRSTDAPAEDNTPEPQDQPADSHQLPNIREDEHLKKTRTCMLLLAILAASLAYQSGLNPPGFFWSRSKDHHSAADRILEDTHHRRFIAFFYLNAIAFVASIVMITLLLNKMASDKVNNSSKQSTAETRRAAFSTALGDAPVVRAAKSIRALLRVIVAGEDAECGRPLPFGGRGGAMERTCPVPVTGEVTPDPARDEDRGDDARAMAGKAMRGEEGGADLQADVACTTERLRLQSSHGSAKE
ncbi:uncharacterized protein [Triticum aestivum]|uniref:uncharacterized protein n=1 Tax=Triticum aestivum TaxID=4565 RepID=UPI001D024C52|nr:uncharacterized protein LOC123153242 [Triticum aestivum]